jgi:hypothetical protein
MIEQRVLLTPVHQTRVLCIRARVLGLLYKEFTPPDAEVLSLAET